MTDFKISTDFNYQKTAINEQDTVFVPAASNASATYDHNLGYIPSARVWFDPNANGIWYPLTYQQFSDSVTGDVFETGGSYYLTTTQLVVNLFDSFGGGKDIPIAVRVYYDD